MQPAALHSALFNYTPLVIRGTDKHKQLTTGRRKLALTAMNKLFSILKSLEPLKIQKPAASLSKAFYYTAALRV
jgi:hypothetical protein